MKLKNALSSAQIEAVSRVLQRHFDQSALNELGESAEAFASAINDCLGQIKKKASEENNILFLAQYRDQVKLLIEVRGDLVAALTENAHQVELIRKEINDLID